MTSFFNPDPLGLGVPALLDCVGCGRMRPTEESRQIMVANIQSRLAGAHDAAAYRQDRYKLARLRAGDWLAILPTIATALYERYAAFVNGLPNAIAVP